jgi:hypothetical protein
MDARERNPYSCNPGIEAARSEIIRVEFRSRRQAVSLPFGRTSAYLFGISRHSNPPLQPAAVGV